ncbi:MAG: metal ABC transporter substrate-binding protein [Armatimonadota bacterium]
MKRSILTALMIIAIAQSIIGGCNHRPESRLQVVATTTMMESAISDIGGKYVDVAVLIPPGSCPGHYDIRPGDVRNIKRSYALFTHGYEQFVPQLLESVGKPGPQVCEVPVKGNWLIPDIYAEACREVSRQLSSIDPGHDNAYRDRCTSLCARASRVDRELRRKVTDAGIESLAVICSDQQSPFLKWMRADVVGTYGRTEEFTPIQLHDLTMIGRKKKVCLIIDNLQSGPTAGRQLAEEIGALHLTFSNYPGGFPNTASWEKCLRKNVALLLSALRSIQEKQRT